MQQLVNSSISTHATGLTVSDLEKKLKSELESKIDGKNFDEELEKALEWLGEERLIEPFFRDGDTGYILGHNKLIQAWQRIERNQGDKAKEAQRLLDGRLAARKEFEEARHSVRPLWRQLDHLWGVLWNRSSEKKHLLNLRELWFIKRHLAPQELKQGARSSLRNKN